MTEQSKRPNIVFLFADDWGRYASAYRQFQSENSLPKLWSSANLDERRRLLLTILDAVYVDSKENMIVAIKPKAPFKPVFEVATTREGSDVVLVHDREVEPRIADQPPLNGHGLEADSCSWWRRGREPVSEVGNAAPACGSG